LEDEGVGAFFWEVGEGHGAVDGFLCGGATTCEGGGTGIQVCEDVFGEGEGD